MSEFRFSILDPTESERTDNGYLHRQCGRMLMGLPVHFSNRDGVTPNSGDGSVQIIVVPYCPTEECGGQPVDHGTITNGIPSHPSIEARYLS
jgi:hypothetical protein